MAKIKLLGIGKSKFHNYYCLEKKQKFFSGFRKFLLDLGFEKFEVERFGRPTDKHGEPYLSKENSIEAYADTHRFFQNKEYLIDLVFGKKRIFLIINSKKDRQREISQKIKSFCSP